MVTSRFIFALLLCIKVAYILGVEEFQGKPIINLGQQRSGFQGDLKFPPGRNGILKAKRWPGGVIPYDYGTSWPSEHDSMIQTAMRTIEKNTCIRFVRRTNQNDFIRITNTTGGCYTFPGRSGGQQMLSLMDGYGGTCFLHRIIVHELMHVVGLWHEQMRPDRDQYLTINWQNIPNDQGTKYQFTKLADSESSVYGMPYNYESVMHYDAYAFTANGGITMQPKDARFTKVIGTGQGHEYDWEKARRIYDCSKGGNNGNIGNTNNGNGNGNGDSSSDCVDRNGGCAGWAKGGECTRNPGYMQANCYKSCNPSKCGGGNGGGNGKENSNCKYKIDYCNQYVSSCGSADWMKDYCKSTCNFC
jgi:hypothetical protein